MLALVAGRTIVTLPPCQDHKRAGDGDTGPNTGGMGAYCPAPRDAGIAASNRRKGAGADGPRHESAVGGRWRWKSRPLSAASSTLA